MFFHFVNLKNASNTYCTFSFCKLKSASKTCFFIFFKSEKQFKRWFPCCKLEKQLKNLLFLFYKYEENASKTYFFHFVNLLPKYALGPIKSLLVADIEREELGFFILKYHPLISLALTYSSVF